MKKPRDKLAAALAANPRDFVFVMGAGVTIGAVSGTEAAMYASWSGLIRHGLRNAVSLGQLEKPDADRLEALLDSDRPGLWIAAAGQLSEALGAPSGGDFRQWLREAVGCFSTSIQDRSVVDVLRDFERRGVTLATVNYDSVLEEATGLPAVTWKQPTEVERVLRGQSRGILHLHGHWEDPESIVFGTRSYDEVVRDPHARTTLEAMRMLRTMVFIGHGAGLEDPNWGSLLEWAVNVFRQSEFHHYRVAREADLAGLRDSRLQSQRILLVPYPGSHAGLGPFLRELHGASTPTSPAPSTTGTTPTGTTPTANSDVDHVLLLLNIGEEGYDFVTEQEVITFGQVPGVTVTLETKRVLDLRNASAKQWRAIAADIDGLLARAHQAAIDAPRPVCFVVAGRAPNPAFAYLGYKSKRLNGRVLFVNQRSGKHWDRIGPFSDPSEFPPGTREYFALTPPKAFMRGPGKLALFVGCSSHFTCSERDLSELTEAQGHQLNGLFSIKTDQNKDLSPMDAHDLAPLSELVVRILPALKDVVPENRRFVLAFGGPVWVAFWLGRQLNANVTGSIDFADYVHGRGYVPALASQAWREPWVAGDPNVLLLAAEPDNETRTRAAASLNAIKRSIEQERGQRALLGVRDIGALRITELLRELDHGRPHILHISAHGREDGSLALEDERGHVRPISADAFVAMLRSAGIRPAVILIAACHSKILASALAELCDCVLSVSGEVPYQVVVPFVRGFYGALARGRSVGEAFEQGQSQAHAEFDVGKVFFGIDPGEGVDPYAMFFWERPVRD